MRRVSTRPIPIDKNQVREIERRIWAELYKPNSRVGVTLGPAFAPILRRMPSSETPIHELPGASSFIVDGGVYKSTSVVGSDVQVPVMLDLYKSNSSALIPSGHVESTGEDWDQHLAPIQVVLFLNSTKTLRQIREGEARLKKELRSVLVHELTHAHDLIPKETSNTYFQDPVELRAFMQQVADEVLEEHLRRPRDIRRILQESVFWNSLAPHLTPMHRRHILKGVARALEDLGG